MSTNAATNLAQLKVVVAARIKQIVAPEDAVGRDIQAQAQARAMSFDASQIHAEIRG